ncbi:hypothetical protein HS088_TW06G00364 [Tripterygium wilfordii]|uniref:Uncharacterized protein n=1 Tax=Tripterygium wilfordii TaxID=458696 RepID=A0A7J7DIN2_TRIWF|nr:hypothetical protein HS088_TW06G00364 [Tripterygium wilfordii]
MKQKVVIKVPINGYKYCCGVPMSGLCFRRQNLRSKALKIVVGLPGIESAAFGGRDKDQIVVTGEEIDAVQLTNILRRKVGYSELVSVTPVEDQKEEPKEQPMVCFHGYGVPQYQNYEMRSLNPYHFSI